MKKKLSNRDKTFWAVVIPVVILFFAFNTLPMIKAVNHTFDHRQCIKRKEQNHNGYHDCPECFIPV